MIRSRRLSLSLSRFTFGLDDDDEQDGEDEDEDEEVASIKVAVTSPAGGLIQIFQRVTRSSNSVLFNNQRERERETWRYYQCFDETLRESNEIHPLLQQQQHQQHQIAGHSLVILKGFRIYIYFF